MTTRNLFFIDFLVAGYQTLIGSLQRHIHIDRPGFSRFAFHFTAPLQRLLTTGLLFAAPAFVGAVPCSWSEDWCSRWE